MDRSQGTTVLNRESATRSAGGEEALTRLREFFSSLLQYSDEAPELGRSIADGFLEQLGCATVCLFVAETADASGDRPASAAREFPFSVLAARAALPRKDEATGPSRGATDLTDPEVFVHTPTVRGAFDRGEFVLERNCLLELPPPGSEARRTVFGQAFHLTPERTGVLYLDAPVVAEEDIDEWTDRVADFLSVSLPLLRNTFLEQENRELRRRLREPAAAAESGGGEEETDEQLWDIGDDEVPLFHGIVGRSPRLSEIFEIIQRVKDTDFNVCIFGESGCGKELLAAAIHRAGKRRDHRFVSENCGAISETLLESELFGHVKGAFTGADDDRQGLFELADGGTLFLDEIGDMSEGMQRKLLRVLQEGVVRPIGSKDTIHVDVRVICASNRDLKLLMEKGSFRADLYYRLNVINIEVPPLRERMDDVPYLVKWFLKRIQEREGTRRRLSQSAMRTLMSYTWPGNVRELANVLHRLVITGSGKMVTRKEILPLLSGGPARSYVSQDLEHTDEGGQIVLRIPERQTFNEIISECEKAVLLNALNENRWNKSRVTKVLQIPRQSLYNKIAKYDLRKKWPK